MKESIICDFFLARVGAEALGSDPPKPVASPDKNQARSIAIDDLNSTFLVTRKMAASLCDAAISGHAPAWVVGTIARTLFGSKHFTWEDPLLTEVFGDWSILDGDAKLPPSKLKLQKQQLQECGVGLGGSVLSAPR
jgi:hypothetical protein